MPDTETQPVLNTDGPHSGDYSRQVAALAAEAIRVLNHGTLNDRAGGLKYPADVDSVAASLARMASMLPQLLGQLSRWLEGQQEAGRLEVRHGAYMGDPAAAAASVAYWLNEAQGMAGGLHHALDKAHQVTAAIGAPEDGDA